MPTQRFAGAAMVRQDERGAVPEPAPHPRVLVIGIGNSLLADDGVGVRAIRRLQEERPPADAELVDGGTLNFTLLPYLEDIPALIVIDAAEMGAAPGAIHVFEGAEMDRIVNAGRRNSVHEAGLADLLSMARLLDCLPPRRALVTVQPQRIDWGDALSPPVAEVLPQVCARVRAMTQRWAA